MPLFPRACARQTKIAHKRGSCDPHPSADMRVTISLGSDIPTCDASKPGWQLISGPQNALKQVRFSYQSRQALLHGAQGH